MTDIIQDRIGLGNLQALPQPLNASKGASIEWRKIGDQMLDNDYVDALMDTQAVMRSKIIQQIQIFEKLNAGKL